MDNEVVAPQGGAEPLRVTQIAPFDSEPLIIEVVPDVPLTARGKVVVYRYLSHRWIHEETVSEVAPDETCSASDEHALSHDASALLARTGEQVGWDRR